jgi:hypothetical protein
MTLPELSTLWQQVLDVRTKEQLNLPTPSIAGGSPTIVAVGQFYEQRAHTQQLAKRAEDIRSGRIPPHEDNMLKITGEGRKAALDMRLIDPQLIEYPDCKINALVERVASFYERTKANLGTQLVFCDLSTPKGSGN